MFEARLVQGHILKRLAEALKELVEEGNFCVGTGGITMNAMDKSHVCLISMDLKSDMFEFYRCDRPMSMGVNMANLVKVLKCAGNEDIITMRADDDGDTLTLMFEATKKQDRVSEFELKLLSIDSETLGIPEQDYSALVRMPTHVYQDIFKDMSTIGETVHLAALKGQLKFTTYGDVGTAVVMLRENTTADKPEEDVSIEVMEPVAMTFALRYLNNFAKASPLCGSVQIGLTRDLPVAVMYELNDGHGTLKYFLAPKIDDEEAMEDASEQENSKPA